MFPHLLVNCVGICLFENMTRKVVTTQYGLEANQNTGCYNSVIIEGICIGSRDNSILYMYYQVVEANTLESGLLVAHVRWYVSKAV